MNVRTADPVVPRATSRRRAVRAIALTGACTALLVAPAAGRATLPQTTGTVDLLNQANIVVQGPALNDLVGESIANAGDVNDDGIDDIIVGSTSVTALGRTDAGAAYVIFGSPTLTLVDLANPLGSSGFRILGATALSRTALSVAGAGDVNDDGIDDVIVGAPEADPGSVTNAGTATIIFGSRTVLTDIDLADPLGSRGFEISGGANGDQAGGSVDGAGDVNGDGIDDVIVGAANTDITSPNRLNAGSAFVIYGSSSPTSFSLGSLGSRGFRLDGAVAWDQIGSAVAGAGDFNGDGKADVLVGGPYVEVASTVWAGTAYLVYGSASPTNLNASTLPGARGLRFTGSATTSAQTGGAVAGAGDVNGDGRDDILIGAKGMSSNAGATYVLFGSSNPSSRDLSQAIPPTDGFTITGGAGADQSGISVGGAGDVNGDGIGDIVIGASGADPPSRSNAGRTYVVFGRTTASSVSLASLGSGGIVINGGAANDSLGASVAGGGDVNGDGRPDVLAGAPNADPQARSAAGTAYAVFGFGPPAIAYAAAVAVSEGSAITPLSPTVARTGTPVFSVSPSLPSGLSLNTTTGVISGTPTAATAAATYTVTMTDDVGTVTASVQITVNPASVNPTTNPASVNPTTFAVTVEKTGSGVGTVSSTPSGIDCGTICTASFTSGTTVTLTATPAAGSTFAGWSGSCTGTSTTCAIAVDAAKTATATFAAEPIAIVGDAAVSTMGSATVEVRVPTAGSLVMVGTRSSGTRTVCRSTKSVARAGIVTLRCSPNRATVALLAKRRLPITLAITFRSVAGSRATASVRATLPKRNVGPPEPVTG